ncbi:YjgP/YjgQ family permease [Kaustia mangrovi]|uniref:YjgP/YjgQ family permease n=1 Tax=Kaustia mangrovi TaxID=2593653 RepID=A0A7S8C6E2_9HYPH|nr:LptF/LptG family permease [Kaustia mangrovi]QPC44243.1 YjgP/YjgQ family permease [Kaustia mangrovi]
MAFISITSRYIIRQVSGPLFAAMAIGLLVLLAERMVRLLDVTLGKKNSFAIVFEMLAYLVPHYLGLAVPAALFLGLLFGFNRLSKSSELDAFLAAGIGLHQLTRPVLALALALMFAAIAIFGWAQPYTRYAYRSVEYTVKNVDVFYLAEEGVFMQAGSRTFILDKLERSSNEFERIFLFEDRGADGSETVTAERGALIEVPGETRPVLHLENGHRLTVDGWPGAGTSAAQPTSVVGDFSSAETPLGKETSRLFRPRGNDQRELTLPELAMRLDSPPPDATRDEMVAELHKRLVNIFSLPVLPFLAIPFALGRRRGMRAYRFGAALIILVAYHEILEQGTLLVRVGQLSPYIALWLPYAVLTVFSGWRYYRACFTVRQEWLEPLADRVNETIRGLFRRVVRTAEPL